MRMISGIIIGYLVFGVSAFLLFRVTHVDPHAPASLSFKIAAIAYGAFFAFLAGYWGTAIAGRNDMLVAVIIGVIMAALAIASMVKLGRGWSPLSAVVVMVPTELLGGYVRAKRSQRA